MKNYTGLELAVIGMSGKFPGAKDINQFWNNLKNGVESIKVLSTEDLLNEGESSRTINSQNYVKVCANVDDKEYFDADFFNYRPDEAELMDPQIRIFHECCWEALEDAGYSNTENHKIGLFSAGTPNANWKVYSMYKNKENLVDEMTASILREITFLSSKISHCLNLKGPSVFLNTACSSSLVSIHEACNSLLLGECDLAIAGGVTISNDYNVGYEYEKGMIHSKDGKCRPFDKDSNGTVPSEGAGVVILKKLSDAIAANDNIYAVVKGTGINNDGNRKVGFTAPSIKGQAEVIRKAQRIGDVDPKSISYIEAHGTGTTLGDPVEIEALNTAFNNDKSKYCAIGSLKSNMGHMDTAAGVAGFIKTVLALKNKQIPASLHFKNPNPMIDFDNGPFYVNNRLREWTGERPLRAGVSSFGIGGTNAHIILEEAPMREHSPGSREQQLIVLSAKTGNSLEKNIINLVDYLKQRKQVNLPDLAYTLQKGRTRFNHRVSLACNNKEELQKNLSEGKYLRKEVTGFQEDIQNIIFMFSGQGSQYINMGKELYKKERIYREKIDKCLSIAKQYSKEDYFSILFPEERSTDETNSLINNTLYAQPLLFIIEYSLTHLLFNWGIKPNYMIGHSIGEYTAACISGVLSLKDAMQLVIRRGELMSSVEAGSMLNIRTDEEQLQPLIEKHKRINVSVINSRKSLVVSGKEEDINDFQKDLTKDGFDSKKLRTSHAFHSYMMESILDDFEELFTDIEINEPQIPYISNITGEMIRYEDIIKPSYWSNHLRGTVQFLKGTKKLLEKGSATFIEIGPGSSLCNFINERQEQGFETVNTLRQSKQSVDDQKYLVEKLGSLWLNGINIDWDNYYRDESRCRISLPTYSFERIPFTTKVNAYELIANELQGGSGVFDENNVCLHNTTWKLSVLPNKAIELVDHQMNFLVFTGEEQFSSRLIQRLKTAGQNVVEINSDIRFEEIEPHTFKSIDHVVYFRNLDEEYQEISYEKLEENLQKGFLGLSKIAKAISVIEEKNKIHLTVVNNYLAKITEDDLTNPLKATILGPSKIMPLENLNLSCKVVDINYPFESLSALEAQLDQLLNELFYLDKEPLVAYRFKKRWLPSFEINKEEEKTKSRVDILENGNYLVTGGFGGMGFTITDYLARQHGANVILVYRSDFPKRADWKDWLSKNLKEDKVTKRIRQIQAMEETGSKVYLFQADVSNENQVKNLVDYLKNENIEVNGMVWAAGAIDYGGIIQKRSIEDFTRYISSKVHGLLLFEKYFDFKLFDFISLFSSSGNSFYKDKFGQVSYNAANEFLESYPNYALKKMDTHVFSINWCDWLDVGMTVKAVSEQIDTQNIEKINFEIGSGVSPETGGDIFYRCLQNKALVSTIHSKNLLEDLRAESMENQETVLEPLSLSSESSTTLNNEKSNEDKLLEVFSSFFGKNKISRNSDFFELGGDSLKGMMLIARIKQKIGVELAIGDIYKYPTIKEIGEKLLPVSSKIKIAEIPIALTKKYYSLSSVQRRMYFLQVLNEGSIAYNEVDILSVQGKLDEDRLERSLQALIKRHESLRTSFVLHNEIPHQIIEEEFDFKVEYFEGREKDLSSIIEKFIRPFNLENGPLFRVGVIKIAKDRFVFVNDMHHIITDGLSQSIFINDFMSLYLGQELPPLKLQYKDYAEWQNQDDQQLVIGKNKKYWLNEFKEELVPLELPTDFVRPSQKGHSGDSLELRLNKVVTDQIETMASEEKTSVFIVLLTIFYIFLAKLSNQKDITIGVSTGGRYHTDLEGIIGMFVNTLPLRNYPLDELSFKLFLNEVSENTLKGFDKQAFQLDELVDELNFKRDISRNPLFDTMFSYENYEESSLDIPGLTLKPYDEGHPSSKFDLSLIGKKVDDWIHLSFDYSTDLFKRETIERFTSYFQEIVKVVSNSPKIKLSKINFISKEEKQKLLYGFNNTKAIYPKKNTVLDLFMDAVSNYPNEIAVYFENQKLSYHDLNVSANRMASFIMNQGNSKNNIVGLLVEKSIESIIGMLAIFKANCSYLPLDVYQPIDRTLDIIKDLDLKLLLTEKDKIIHYNKYVPVVDISSPELKSIAPCRLKSNLSSNDLAYIIFTSGSTGKPKGVKVKHQSLTNLICSQTKTFEIKKDDRIFQFSSMVFDASLEQIWLALTNGAALVLATKAVMLDNSKFNACLQKFGVTHLDITPTFLENVDLTNQKNLKRIVVGGEECGVSIIKKYSDTYNIYNAYGPTECTVTSTMCKLSKEMVKLNKVPLGIPIANTSIYILDENKNLSPIGVSGELHIGGDGLAIGYLNDKELTDKKFITNPFSKKGKLYATGDLAKWLPDGRIVFLGRKDNQIKIRGYRIELGEIQYHLSNYKKIKKSTVVTKEIRNEKYLVGYFTADEELEASDLICYLSEIMPYYMVPDYFIRLETIPLKISGKLDKNALPDPVFKIEDNFIGAQNEIEQKLVEIWSEVLGIKKELISTKKSFFELGGNSLKIIQLNALINKNFDWELSIVELFQYTSILDLIAFVNNKSTDLEKFKKEADVEISDMQDAINLFD